MPKAEVRTSKGGDHEKAASNTTCDAHDPKGVKMKRILLATVALAALGSASGLAADLPQRL
jgi:hypothetical protein